MGIITTEKQHARLETRNAGLAAKRTTSSVCRTTNQVRHVSKMQPAISSPTSTYFFGSINQQNKNHRVNFKINIGEVGHSVQCNPVKIRQRTMQHYATQCLYGEMNRNSSSAEGGTGTPAHGAPLKAASPSGFHSQPIGVHRCTSDENRR